MLTACDQLLCPERLRSRKEVLSQPSLVPKAPGVYGWYFRSLSGVPATACHALGEFRLLYIGISPSGPPINGKRPSRQNLYRRVRYHMQGNAEGSTLRLSLGCLLADSLGIELRRVGGGKRLTFSAGEEKLSLWMEENARVVWQVCEEPWVLEKELISTVNLPLNLDLNATNPFFPVLSELRRTAKAKARALPILPR